MSFADEVADHTRGQGPGARIVLAINSLPPKVRQEVLDVIDDGDAQATAIARALTKRTGVTINRDMVARFRLSEEQRHAVL